MHKPVNKIRIAQRTVLTLASLMMAALPFAAQAAGLGRIAVFSALGEPLQAEIEVFATAEEAQSLQTRLAGAEAFRQANVEYLPVLNALKFSTVKERGGRRYIQVSSDRPLNEPFVDMLVELSWAAGRLVREYTFLLDPPDLAAPQATAPAVVATPAAADAVPPAPTSPVQEAPATEPPPVAASSPATSEMTNEEAPRKAKIVESAAEQKRYTVVPGDTLSKIARQHLANGVTLEQMLVALFRGNQSAFSGKNMNRMYAGKILLIPEADVAASVPVGEARKEVVAQAADFNAYRQKLAAVAAQAAAAPEPAATQADSGKIVPRVTEPAPPVVGKDKLEVSRTEAGKDGKTQDGRVAALEEDLIARDKALKEANERSIALEKQLADMKKLVELKSQAGSELQAQAAKPTEPTSPAAPVKPEDTSVAAAATASESSAPAAEPVKPAESAPPPAEKPKKKKVVPPPPPPEPSFMEENGPLVFGGGGILALLLGWFGFKTWKKRKSAVIDEGGDAEFAAYSSLSRPREDFPLPSEQQPSRFSETVVPPPIDVLAEADTFLAFGRDAQAEEVLQSALEHEPERHAIYLKLLDIYAARKNKSDFGATAKRLHALTNGEGDDWDKAAAMGAALDPDNPLYGAPKAAASQAAPAAVAAAPRMDEPPAVPEPPPSVIDFDTTSAVESTPASAIEPLTAEVPDTNILDFDLDLGAATDAAPTAAEATPMLDLSLPDAPADGGTKDANSIDFDFDLNLDTSAVADAVSPEPTFDVTRDTGDTGDTGSVGGTGGDNPEVATKLELAAAYEEMGDRDGARELYQEALAEGSPAQQETARAKLAALG